METLADLPAGINQHGFEACGDYLYAVAGEGGATYLNTNYQYDPANNAWATKAVLPISVQSPVLRSVGGKLYCIGGLTASGVTDKVYEYDPDADEWTEKTSMPTAREDMGSAVIGTKIYVFGGVEPTTPTVYKILEIYDTLTDTWDTTKADMPDYKLLGDFGCAYNGKIYAIGATKTMTDYPTLTVETTVWEYDPDADEWSVKEPIPVSTCYKEVVTLNGYLYVVSGCTTNTTTYTNAAYRYNPADNTWSVAEFVSPYAARGIGLCTYNSKIYLCGGYSGSMLANVRVIQ